jgi:hypothetical protein
MKPRQQAGFFHSHPSFYQGRGIGATEISSKVDKKAFGLLTARPL